MLTGENTLLVHFGWTVWHEGVRIYNDGLSAGFRDINHIRSEAISQQSHNQSAAAMIRHASNDILMDLLPIVNERVYIEFNLPLHFGWVAHHEGALNSFRQALSEGRISDIRSQYYSEQSHNPDARHLLAAMSDRNIERLVNGL